MTQQLIVFISGRGKNLQAILESPVGGQVAAVISDNPAAAGIIYAEQRNIPCYINDYAACNTHAEFEQKTLRQVHRHTPAMIALAGFMRILSSGFIADCGVPIINIHPSLLPALPGLHTHRRALAAGMNQHGCSVHYVNEQVDGGDIIDSAALSIETTDTEDTLAMRVLELERRLYPQVLARLLTDGQGG